MCGGELYMYVYLENEFMGIKIWKIIYFKTRVSRKIKMFDKVRLIGKNIDIINKFLLYIVIINCY